MIQYNRTGLSDKIAIKEIYLLTMKCGKEESDMYKVFLVDDEALIREGIKNLIDWGQYGFSFAGEASDGEMAWPMIQKIQPDLILTDVKMPFMDGLELSRLVKKEMPKITIAIISGYDEFSYAKQALSIGVNEYLLKPVSRKQLIETLITLKEKMDAQHERTKAWDSQMKEYLEASRNSLLDALLNGRKSVPELLSWAKRLEIDLTAEQYNVVYLRLGGAEYDPAQLVEIQDRIRCEFPDIEGVFHCNIGGVGIAFLIAAGQAELESKKQQCIHSAELICEKKSALSEWLIESGAPVSRLSSVAGSFQEVRGRTEQKYIRSGYSGAQIDFDPNTMNPAMFDRKLIGKFLSVGQREQIAEFVRSYFLSMQTQAMESLLFRQYLVLHIQFCVNFFLQHISRDEGENREYRTDSPAMESFTTLESTEQYVQGLMEYAISVRDSAANHRYNGIIRKAVEYMEQHYSDSDIDLNTVAQVVNVRSTYLSAVFSQQMGKTFVEYLTGLRMEKARALLRCTDKSSGDIAFEVGYNNPHYFSSLFKKVNGCTPRDYRSGKELS